MPTTTWHSEFLVSIQMVPLKLLYWKTRETRERSLEAGMNKIIGFNEQVTNKTMLQSQHHTLTLLQEDRFGQIVEVTVYDPKGPGRFSETHFIDQSFLIWNMSTFPTQYCYIVTLELLRQRIHEGTLNRITITKQSALSCGKK